MKKLVSLSRVVTVIATIAIASSSLAQPPGGSGPGGGGPGGPGLGPIFPIPFPPPIPPGQTAQRPLLDRRGALDRLDIDLQPQLLPRISAGSQVTRQELTRQESSDRLTARPILKPCSGDFLTSILDSRGFAALSFPELANSGELHDEFLQSHDKRWNVGSCGGSRNKNDASQEPATKSSRISPRTAGARPPR